LISSTNQETIWDRFCEFGFEAVAADIVVSFLPVFAVTLATRVIRSHHVTWSEAQAQLPIALIIAFAISASITGAMYFGAWFELGGPPEVR
jgi:hypothetical protein